MNATFRLHTLRSYAYMQFAGSAKGANYSSDVTELAKAMGKGKLGPYIHIIYR